MFILEILKNSEGSNLAIISVEGDGGGYRIAGPKAWGGSRNIATLKISEADLVTFIKDYAPGVQKMLSA